MEQQVSTEDGGDEAMVLSLRQTRDRDCSNRVLASLRSESRKDVSDVGRDIGFATAAWRTLTRMG